MIHTKIHYILCPDWFTVISSDIDQIYEGLWEFLNVYVESVII